MGVNIMLQSASYADHPDWDWSRMAGDRDFMGWMDGLSVVERVAGDHEEGFRPADISAWRARLPADRPNPERFPRLFDLLERDPALWIRISW